MKFIYNSYIAQIYKDTSVREDEKKDIKSHFKKLNDCPHVQRRATLAKLLKMDS